ncbi:hypothetical protein [Streptomyces sp. I05A-00742]|uniref:hypothetical protein n=1 Tax=Streptomyces sp. I05A-00742 TaxID=2732853 RepID=UPI00148A021D|nr:hypothetical protein [Streptomyces sp. I05A-00742]
MTTPPFTGPQAAPPFPGPPPAFPPPFPPPFPPAPPRRRRAAVAGAVALGVLLAGGAGTAWWLSRGEDGSPLAGRPRVTDDAAGLSYAIPEGWKQSKGKLISAFTTTIGREKQRGEPDGEQTATVLAGRSGRPVPPAELGRVAERAARSNAEFFFPDRPATPEESRAVTVDDRPAHTVALRVDTEKDGPARLRFTLVALDGDRAAFLMGVAQPAGGRAQQEVDAVLESAEVTSRGAAVTGSRDTARSAAARTEYAVARRTP